ncbi:di-trans,poly-cis-decaprenylcistransferase [Halostreptopolyspora alba]|uniref:Isoprenyl transferase n=2 Tax=Halostreptopolyspora alba TaxID=2487137 RepID=A0A3N0E8Q7_9ACTN|nr:di-trans,poly-cis-decaprenylcistransferase [Nocardiopsaceae bacterium YIM 96095]
MHARTHHLSYTTVDLLPAPKRPHIHALSAFALWADHLADEGREGDRPRAVARLRETIFQELETARSTHPVRRAFVHTAKVWELDRDALLEYLSALEKDCGEPVDFATFEELRGFLRGHSGAWAELTTPLLEPAGQEAPRLMSVLGEAFQLAEVLSDLVIDLRRGRCYLPRCDLEQFDLTAQALRNRRPGRAHTELIRFEVDRARALLAEGARGREAVHPSSEPFVSALTNGMDLWLSEIERRGNALLRTPLDLPTPPRNGLATSSFQSWMTRPPARPAGRGHRRASWLDRLRSRRQRGGTTVSEPPRHIAVIMDGNRRWAAERGRPPIDGHVAGEDAYHRLVDAAIECGVPYLTVFAFSVENWSRSQGEVTALFDMLSERFEALTTRLHNKGVRVLWNGRRDKVSPGLRAKLEHAENLTSGNGRLTFTVCLDYGGRQELVAAAARMAEDALAGRVDPAGLTQDRFARYLYDPELPDVDLLLRTSGEQRTSNFLPWHTAYSEIVFEDILWPDFQEAHLRHAISAYAGRQRRFGGGSGAMLKGVR